MQPKSDVPAQGLPIIDALRGVAILSVILVHAREPFASHMSGFTHAIASQGGWGVQLFFILSAFTLLLSWTSRNEPAATSRFLVRRFFRVAPMFYGAIVFYALLDGFSRRPYAPEGVGLWEFLVTALFLHGWHPNSINSIVPGGWSIAAEMNFYLMFPFLAMLLTTLQRAILAFGVVTAAGGALTYLLWKTSQLGYAEPGAYLVKGFLLWCLPAQLPVFMIGFIVFHLCKGISHESVNALKTATFGRLLTVGCLAAAVVLAFLPLRGFAYLPYAVIFGLAVWSLFLAPWKAAMHPVLVHIGKVSYSAYFIHFLAVRYSGPLVSPLLPLGDLGFFIYFTVIVAATVGVATLTYRWVELPGIALGRRLASKLPSEAAFPMQRRPVDAA